MRRARFQRTAIAGKRNQRLNPERRDSGAEGRDAQGRRRVDQTPQRAIEAPFRGKGRPALVLQGYMSIHAACREHVDGRLRGKLGASQREPQPVAGHRIDKSGGIARQQQSRDACGCRIDGERAKNCGARHEPRAGKPIAQHRIAIDCRPQYMLRIVETPERVRRADYADVRQSTRQRCNADVPSGVDVHLTHPTRSCSPFGVRSNRPAPRMSR